MEQEATPKRRVNLNTWIILGCVLLLTVVMSISMYYMMAHVKELTASPFVYGAQKTSEIYDGAGLMCTCRIDIPTTNAIGQEKVDPYFFFNTTSTWVNEHERQPYPSFNQTDLSGLFSNQSENMTEVIDKARSGN